MLQKVAITLIFSDNAHEAISENQSARIEKLGSIQKRKWLENMYVKCEQSLGNAFIITYAVYLIRAHKCRFPGGVYGMCDLLHL